MATNGNRIAGISNIACFDPRAMMVKIPNPTANEQMMKICNVEGCECLLDHCCAIDDRGDMALRAVKSLKLCI